MAVTTLKLDYDNVLDWGGVRLVVERLRLARSCNVGHATQLHAALSTSLLHVAIHK
jgi:hypothetical protein